ncbi:MAG: 1,4-beta-N-acetylmuramidase [Ruminococcus sp.]|nr:1,4-beta-N-acetylmuramidase [Ruminococcus sp.]
MATSGIDVSQWQGTINWPQVKGKVDFALIRAGYGDTLSFPYQIDKMYEANYKGCKQAGIPVGVYFYSYASTVEQAQREADSCIALLKGKQFEYPVYYDVEEFDIFRSGNTNAIIKAFCDKLEKAGYFTGIYIYRSALQTYVNKQIRERYAVAVAEYGPKCNYDGPYGIWQNTSDWSCSGISGRVDHDYCYVDYPKIIREAGMNGFSKTVPTVKPTPAHKPAKKTVDQIAREVIAGDWGAGEERRKRLTAAGYDYDAVQNKVNEILYGTKPQPAKKSVDQIAREVIRGDWGAGEERRKRLTAAGYDYNAVQKRVNEILYG